MVRSEGWWDTLLFRARRAMPLSSFFERSRFVFAPASLSSVRVTGRGAGRGLRAVARGEARRWARFCSPVAGALDGLPVRIEVGQNVGAHLLRFDCRAWDVCVKVSALANAATQAAAGQAGAQAGGQCAVLSCDLAGGSELVAGLAHL